MPHKSFRLRGLEIRSGWSCEDDQKLPGLDWTKVDLSPLCITVGVALGLAKQSPSRKNVS